jgi:hypothetical protein
MSHKKAQKVRPLLAIVVLMFAVVFSSTYTQTKQDDTNAALREKAFSLLESVAGQLNTLQSGENRARLGANIVGSLWKHDEKRARALLLLVQEDINAGLDVKKKLDQTDEYTFAVFFKLRVDTAERVAKYDGEAALAFFQATAPRSDKPLPESLLHYERQLELQLAHKVALTNPDAALKVARKSLDQGFHGDLIAVLTQLNRKHKEQAQILYKEIVQKFKDADLISNWEARNLVESLTQYFKPPAVDPATYRELATLLTSSALANGCANKMNDEDQRAEYCQWVTALIPQMQSLDPRAARLKHWAADDQPEEQSESNFDLTEIVQSANPEDLAALVTKYPDSAEDIVYRLVLRMGSSGDYEQARKIANRYVTDDQTRRLMLAQLDFHEKLSTLDEQTLAQLEARINATEDLAERLGLLMEVYQQYGGNNPKTTLKLLNLASEIIDTMKPGREQTLSQIKVAMMYCLEKNDRGLSIMESLLPKLNELVDVAAKLDGYDTRYLRDGEWNMSANGAVGELLTVLAQNAGHFAWCDFDRAVSLAARFDRTEIRLMAQVKLAQGILAGPPQRVRQPIQPFYRH